MGACRMRSKAFNSSRRRLVSSQRVPGAHELAGSSTPCVAIADSVRLARLVIRSCWRARRALAAL
eukprot:5252155-Prymnesium_polylepis.1